MMLTELQEQIDELSKKLESDATGNSKSRQLIIDEIASKRREIECLSRKEQIAVSITNAPTVAERSQGKRSSLF